jgi:hypothetical protein
VRILRGVAEESDDYNGLLRVRHVKGQVTLLPNNLLFLKSLSQSASGLKSCCACSRCPKSCPHSDILVAAPLSSPTSILTFRDGCDSLRSSRLSTRQLRASPMRKSAFIFLAFYRHPILRTFLSYRLIVYGRLLQKCYLMSPFSS